jgi:hypothetical protein
VLTRLAIAIFVLSFLGAAAATLAPVDAGYGSSCGTWLDPNPLYQLGHQPRVEHGGASRGIHTFARESSTIYLTDVQSPCVDKLRARRGLAELLAGIGIVVPVGILLAFGGPRSQRKPA